jgi:hypothetical protein
MLAVKGVEGFMFGSPGIFLVDIVSGPISTLRKSKGVKGSVLQVLARIRADRAAWSIIIFVLLFSSQVNNSLQS